MAHKEFPIIPSTIESIDETFFKWVDEEINVYATTNKGWKKIPAIWVSAERAFQVKHKKELRDDAGSLILPLLTVERTGISKDPHKKGAFWGNVPPVDDYRGGSITIGRKINQDKTSNFANAKSFRNNRQVNFPEANEKIVYEYTSIPMPVYITVTYNLTLRTEYQQQMNEMMTPFITRTGGINYFSLRSNGHFYEGFIQPSFSSGNNVAGLAQDERKYETTIPIEVLGYLIGEDKNQEAPKVVIRENQVDVKLPRERVIFEDDPDCEDKASFCREQRTLEVFITIY